jgi:threonine/homoserine/homoserine lactone efflux protein
MTKKAFTKGFSTGLILQLALGPIFIFIINIAIQSGLRNGLFAVIAVTVVDYIYIMMAILGVGRLLKRKSLRNILTGISSLILMLFGLLIVFKGVNSDFFQSYKITDSQSSIKSFTAAFILTLSNPLTIVFWTSIFTSESSESSFNKNELWVFGLSAGLSTLIFLSGCVAFFSYVNTVIPPLMFKLLNITVGIIIIFYGINRGVDLLKKDV